MRPALFGKLPAKRDFVAAGAPREFLELWEAWLQGGLSASRVRLGEGWQSAFLRAPIWRFWLGADLCGFPVLGAFMPSVDGVGRYFPLTVLAYPEQGEPLVPPELDPHERWLAAAEEVLLSALAEGATLEAVTEALARLPTVSDATGPDGSEPAPVRSRGGALVLRVAGAPAPDVFGRLRRADQARADASMTVWWTAGGGDYGPAVINCRRMPDPYLFAGMLTGAFDRER